ncbi:hypothetical protein KVV02_003818 [Mortierella alpina]|uniref:Uncharacterized protein n=1 Tax=Mortierella alpina TaxID=64518 RepID=A0A9P8I9D8_MORAP|nr:hypothetical protein KVV02_003818 [Mortierella alpina]
MWAPSLSTIHTLQVFTFGLVFGSILHFASSYAIEGGIGVAPYSRIFTNVNIALFLWNKNSMSLSGQRKLQIFALCLSALWVLVLLGLAGWLIYVAQTKGMAIVYLVVVFDIPIALLLLSEAVLMELYSQQLNGQCATSSRNRDRLPAGSSAPESESTFPFWHNGTNNR